MPLSDYIGLLMDLVEQCWRERCRGLFALSVVDEMKKERCSDCLLLIVVRVA